MSVSSFESALQCRPASFEKTMRGPAAFMFDA